MRGNLSIRRLCDILLYKERPSRDAFALRAERLVVSAKRAIAVVVLVSLCVSDASVTSILSQSFTVEKTHAATGIFRPISYQGKIVTGSGSAITDGTYNMQFKIYDAATTGTLLWTETWNNSTQRISMTGGLFTALLGTHVPMTNVNFNTDSLYLQVEFDPGNDGTYEEVFAPRRRFAAVPYAHNADLLDGRDAAAFLWSDSSITASGTLTVRPRDATKTGIDIQSNAGAAAVAALKLSTQGANHIVFGSGAANYDTNLYRIAPAILKTDGTFIATAGFSGATLHATRGITTSGSVLANGNISTSGTLSGAALKIMAGNSYFLGNLGIGKSATPNTKLEVVGTISGSALRILGLISGSGGILISGTSTFRGALSGSSLTISNLNSCALVVTNANGTLSCGTASGFNQTSADARYLQLAGGTLTGALAVRASISGSSLTVSNLNSCALVVTNANGTLSCGTTTAGWGTGNTITVGDSRYLRRSGGTLTGTLVIRSASGANAVGLNVIGGISGSYLTVSGTIAASGSIVSRGNITARGILSGSFLTINGSTSIAGNASHSGSIIANGNITTRGTLSGKTLVISGNASITGGLLSVRNIVTRQIFSGAGLVINGNSNITGNISVTGSIIANGNISTRATLSGAALKIMAGNSYFLGNLGIGKSTTPNTKLEVVGTISGSALKISSLISGSGGIIITGTSTFRGALSGSSLTVSNLNSCAIIITNANGTLSCGTIAAGWGTGNTITVGDSRYLRRSGGTLTGTLVIRSTSGSNAVGLNVIGGISGASLTINGNSNIAGNTSISGSLTANGSLRVRGTLSGNILHIEKTITSSGIILANGNIATRGTLSGAALTILSGNSYFLGNLGIGKSTTPNTKLEVVGTISGSALRILGLISGSGGILITGMSTFRGALSGSSLTVSNLNSCAIIVTNANGSLSCGTVSFTQASADARYLKLSGGTLTGSLIIRSTSGANAVGLNVIGTISGSALRITNNASVSGSLVVLANSTFKGILNVNSNLVASGQANALGATTITPNGAFVALTLKASPGGGAIQLWKNSAATVTYGTITSSGSLNITPAANARTALNVVGTISGSALIVSGLISGSGGILITGTSTFRGALSGSSLTVSNLNSCAIIITNANGTLSCGTVSFTQSSADARYLRKSGGTLTGTLVVRSASGANAVGLNVIGGISGASLTINGNSNISGSETVSGTLLARGNITTRGTLSGKSLYISGTGSQPLVSQDQSHGTVLIGTGGILKGGTGAMAPNLYIPGRVPITWIGSGATALSPVFIVIQGRYAYIVSAVGNTLTIFDVSNPSKFVAVGSVATGSSPQSVSVQGRYAYVANSTSGTLSIYDISNPSSPIAVGSVATGSGPKSVSVQGRYAYVANTTSNTLSIVDISNPNAPIKVGSITTALQPNSVSVQGRYAYVTALLGGTLAIYDISNPFSPAAIGSVSPGSLLSSVFVQGRYAYVPSNGGFSILDISNPSAPRLVSSITIGVAPVGVFVQGRYAYVVNSTSNTLSIVDISNPSIPRTVGSFPTGSSPRSVYVQGRNAYVVNANNNSFTSYDLGGAYVQQLEVGGIEAGTLSVRTNASIYGNLDVAGGATFGRGFNANAPSAILNSSTGANAFTITSTYSGALRIAARGTVGTEHILFGTGSIFDVSLRRPAAGILQTNATFYAAGFSGSALTIRGTISGSALKISSLISGSGGILISGTSTFRGALSGSSLTVSNLNSCALIITNANGTLSCGTVSFTQASADARYLRKSGGTLTGTLVIRSASGSNAVGLNVIGGISGSYLTVSGTIAASGSIVSRGNITARGILSGSFLTINGSTSIAGNASHSGSIIANGNISTRATLSGAALKIMAGNSYFLGNLGIGKSATPNTRLEVVGTISGSALRILGLISGSGGILISGTSTFRGALSGSSLTVSNLNSCALVITNANGTLSCGTIAAGWGTGNTITVGDSRYLRRSGGTLTGTLVIRSASGTTAVGLNVAGTMSGRGLIISGTGSQPLIATDIAHGTVMIGTGGMLRGGTGAITPNLYIPGSVPTARIGSGALATSPQNFAVQGRYAYVVNSNGASSVIQSMDLSDPARPVVISSTTLALGSNSIKVQGHYAYVLSNAALKIVDISNPASMQVVGSITGLNTTAQDVYVQGRYAYVTANFSNAGIQVIDISNPSQPLIASSFRISGVDMRGITVQGSYAYVADVTISGFIVNISNPQNLKSPVGTGFIGNGSVVAVQGRYEYLGYSGGVQINDVKNPAVPVQLSLFATASVTGIAVQGRYMYVSVGASNYVKVVDISNPGAPILVGTINTGGSPRIINVQGRYLYVINNTDKSLHVYDLGGAYIQSIEAGSIEAGTLSVRNNLTVYNNADIVGGLTIGRGLQVQGPSSFLNTATGGTALTITSTYSGALRISARGGVGAEHILFGTGSIFDVSLRRPTGGVLQTNANFYAASFSGTGLRINGSGSFLGTLSGAALRLNSSGNSFVPLTVKGFNNQQLGNLAKFQTSSGGTVFAITSSGDLVMSPFGGAGKSSPTIKLQATNSLAAVSTATIRNTYNGNGVPALEMRSAANLASLVLEDSAGGQAYFNAGFLNLAGTLRNNSLGTIVISPYNKASVGLFVQGLTGQSADLQQWRDVNASVLASISQSGALTLNNTASHPPAIVLNARGTISGASLTVMSGNSYLLGKVAIGKASNAAGTALDVLGTISGSSLKISSLISGSGGIIISGTSTFRGALSGSSLTVSNLNSCAIIITNANGTLSCGTIAAGWGSGNTITVGDSRYLRRSGGTLTGTLVIRSTSGSTAVGLNVIGGISGSYLTVSGTIAASGSIVTRGNITARGILSGSFLTINGSTSIAGNASHSGSIIANGNISTRATLSGAALTILSGNSYFLGNLGIGKSTTPNTKLEVVGTISGSALRILGLISGSGGILITGTSTFRGALSGSSLTVSNLNSCAIIVTNANGTLSCGTVSFTQSSADARYLRKSGGTLTGTLVIRSVSGTTAVGLNVAGTMSGRGLIITGTGSQPLIATDIKNGTVLIGTGGILKGGTGSMAPQLYVAGRVPVLVGSGSVGIQSALHDEFTVQGRYAYVTSGTFKIYDISNPKKSVLVGSLASVGGGQTIVQGRYAYIMDQGGNVVRIVDISRPTTPALVGTVAVTGSPRGIAVAGRYLYVGNSTGTNIQVIDIGNPLSPIIVSTIPGVTSPTGLTVQGNYLYAAGGQRMWIYDISNPAAPVFMSSVVLANGGGSIAIQGRYVYIGSSNSADFYVIDVVDPLVPRLLTTMTLSSANKGVSLQGRYLYAVSDILRVIDISNPYAPVITATAAINGNTSGGVATQGRYTYVFASASLQTFDLGGAYIQQLEAGGLEAGTLSVRTSAFIYGDLDVRGSAVFGRGISVSGPSAFINTLTGANTLTIISTYSGALRIAARGTVGTEHILFGTGSIFDVSLRRPTGNTLQTNANFYAASLSGTQLFVRGTMSGTSLGLNGATAAGTTALKVYGSGSFVGTLSGSRITANGPTSNVGYALVVRALQDGGAGGGIKLLNLSQNASVTIDTATMVLPGTYGIRATSNLYFQTGGNQAVGLNILSSSNVTIGVNSSTFNPGTRLALSGAMVIDVTGNLKAGKGGSGSALTVVGTISGSRLKIQSLISGSGGILISGTSTFRGVLSGSSLTVSNLNSCAIIITNANGTLSCGTIAAGWGTGNTITVGDSRYLRRSGGTLTGTLVIRSTSGANAVGLNVIGGISGSYLTVSGTIASSGSIVSRGSITARGILSGSFLTINGSTSIAGNASHSGSIIANGNISTRATLSGAALTILSGNSYFLGNLGIGKSATPNTKLEVVGTISGSALRILGLISGSGGILISGTSTFRGALSGSSLTVSNLNSCALVITNANGTLSCGTIAAGWGTGNTITVGDSRYLRRSGGTLTGTLVIRSTSGSNAVGLNVAGTMSGRGLTISGTGSQPLIATDIKNGTVLIGTGGILKGGTGSMAPNLYIPGRMPTSAVGTATTGTAPYGIYVQGRYVYEVNNTSHTLEIFDYNNPNLPVRVSSLSVGATPNAVVVQGHYAYIVDQVAAGKLYIVDVSNPSVPVQVSTIAAGNQPIAITVQGRYAYVANFVSNTLQTFDISNPLAPALLNTTATATGPLGIGVQGSYVYVTTWTSAGAAGSLQIFNVANPGSPALVKTLNTNAGGYWVTVQGRYAYISTVSYGVQIADISNPSTAAIVGNVAVANTNYAVAVQGRYAYTINYESSTLRMIDISNPRLPVLVGTVSTASSPTNLFVQGRYLYVLALGANKIQTFDLGGAYIQQLEVGGLEAGTLSVRNNLSVYGSADIRGGLSVGNGLQVSGPSSFVDTSTGASALTIISTYSGALRIAARGTASTAQIMFGTGITFDVSLRRPTGMVLQTNANFYAASLSGSNVTARNTLSGSNLVVSSNAAFSGALTFRGGTATFGSASNTSLRLTINSLGQLVASEVGVSDTSVKLGTVANGGVMLSNAQSISFTNGNNIGFSKDVGILRLRGGVLKITNGSTGTGYLLARGVSIGTANTGSALNVVGTISGSSLKISGLISGSGGIIISGTSTFRGALSGSSLTVSNLNSCAIIITNANGTLSCGTIAAGWGSGNTITVGDSRYLRRSGGTLTGTLVIRSTSGSNAVGLNVIGGISGSYLTVSGTIAASGSIVSRGNITARGILSGSFLTINGSTSIAGNASHSGSIVANGNIATRATLSGAALKIMAGNSYFLGNLGIGKSATPNTKLEVVGTISGSALRILGLISGSGGILISGTSTFRGVLSGSSLTVSNLNSCALVVTNANGTLSCGTIAAGWGSGNTITIGDARYLRRSGGTLTGTLVIRSVSGTTAVGLNVAGTMSGRGLIISGTGSQPLIATNQQYGTIMMGTGSMKNSTGSFAPQLYVAGRTPISLVGSGATGLSGGYAVVQGRYMYLGGVGGIRIYDVTNPNAPLLVGSLSTVANIQRMSVQGRYLYATDFNATNTMYIIDVSNPAAPFIMSSFAAPGSVRQVTVQGKYAYIAATNTNQLNIVDVSNPSIPQLSWSGATLGAPYLMRVVGRYAYITANTANKLQIFDVSNPKNAVSISSVTVGTNPIGLDIQSGYAYVGDNSGGFKIVDIRIPTAPVVVSTLTGNGQVFDVKVQGRYAYLTNLSGNNVRVIDISNPNVPVLIGTIPVTAPFTASVQGRYMYVGTNTRNFSIFDLGGAYIQSLEVGSLEAGTLSVRNDLSVFGSADIRGGLSIGAGLQVQGPSSFLNTATGANTLTIISTYSGALRIAARGTASTAQIMFGTGITFDVSLRRPTGMVLQTNANFYAASLSGTQLFVRGTMSGASLGLNGATAAGTTALKVYGSGSFVGTLSGSRITANGPTSNVGYALVVRALQDGGAGGGIKLLNLSQNASVTIDTATMVFAGPYGIRTGGTNPLYFQTGVNQLASMVLLGAGNITMGVSSSTFVPGTKLALSGAMVIDATGLLKAGKGGSGSALTVVGAISGGTLTVNGNIILPNTTSPSRGAIYMNGNAVLRMVNTNLFGGPNAGNLSLTGTNNTAYGSGALRSLTSGAQNFGMGLDAGKNITQGSNNFALGQGSLAALTTGGTNIAIGNAALAAFSSTTSNVAIGTFALTNATTGGDNTAIGAINTLSQNITGTKNVALGTQALQNSLQSFNTAVGYNALVSYTMGSGATAVGYQAGRGNITGNNNTYLGYQSGYLGTSSNLNNTTTVGANAIVTRSNSLILGSGANVGINTTAPRTRLEVVGAMSGSSLFTSNLLATSGALVIHNPTTVATTNLISVSSDYSSANNLVFRVSSSGAVYADGVYNSAGADYAEWFRTSLPGAVSGGPLVPGELVCIDPLHANTVNRCGREADTNIIGIVSTKPSFVGNSIGGADGIIPPGYVLVGLIGQVPAKVIASSGAIHPGDQLTASSTPGIARKANAGESTVGVALENIAAGQTAVINVLISRRNQSLTGEMVGQKVLDQIAAMGIDDQIRQKIEDAIQNLNLDQRVMDDVQVEFRKMDLTRTINSIIDQHVGSGTLVTGDRLQNAVADIRLLISQNKDAALSLSGVLLSLQDRYGFQNMNGVFAINTNTSINGSLKVSSLLSSSGGLVIQGSVTFKDLVNCPSIKTDANGTLMCGAATGLSQAESDARYLQKSGGTLTGTLALHVAETDGAKDMFKIVTNVNHNDSTVFRVTATGAVYSNATFNSAGADYAEWFYSADRDLQKGEVVCIDTTRSNAVKRCGNNADSNVMGIVSTHPAFIGNSIGGANGSLGITPPGYVLIGLIGQVPAKVIVASDSGSLAVIRPGDSLTASAVPGIARKAKAGESTVGVALEGFNGAGVGTINVLISRRNQSLTVETVEGHVLEAIKNMAIEDEVQKMVAKTMDNVNFNGAVTAEVQMQLEKLSIQEQITQVLTDLQTLKASVAGRASGSGAAIAPSSLSSAGNVHIGGDTTLSGSLAAGAGITADTLQILSTAVVGSDLRVGGDFYLEGTLIASDLYVPNGLTVDGDIIAKSGRFHAAALETSSGATISGSLVLRGDMHMASGSLVLGSGSGSIRMGSGVIRAENLIVRDAVQVLGNITIAGLAQFLGNVEVRGQLIVSSKQAGFAVIGKGQTSVTVSFGSGFTAQPVVTASPDVPVLYAVSKATMTGFTIRIVAPATEEITFSWLSLGTVSVEETASTQVPAGPVPFPVDEHGVPVSSSAVWNACIRSQIMLDETGQPYNCSRYVHDYTWQQPDLHMDFQWLTNVDPPQLQLPDGYFAQVQMTALSESSSSVEISSSSASSESFVSSSSSESSNSANQSSNESSSSSASFDSSASSASSDSSSSSDSAISPLSASLLSPSGSAEVAGPADKQTTIQQILEDIQH